MGFDLYETLIEMRPLAEVLKFAAGRAQGNATDETECAVSSAPTTRVNYSPDERGTDSIPISVAADRVASHLADEILTEELAKHGIEMSPAEPSGEEPKP